MKFTVNLRKTYISVDLNAINLFIITGYLPSRYIISIIYFFGFTLNYFIRISMNLAVVAMVLPANATNSNNVTVNECKFEVDEDAANDYVSSLITCTLK